MPQGGPDPAPLNKAGGPAFFPLIDAGFRRRVSPHADVFGCLLPSLRGRYRLDGMVRANPLRPLVWLADVIQAPPFSEKALEIALGLLDSLRRFEAIPRTRVRPMPSVAAGCAELKIRDGEANKAWRILYPIDPDAIVIAAVFEKTSSKTPRHVIEAARKRLKRYDEIKKEAHGL